VSPGNVEVNPGYIGEGPPYSADLVTFGDDWVRITTGGYNMYEGFEIFIGLQTAPNEIDPDPAPVPDRPTLTLLGLGAGSLVARRVKKARGVGGVSSEPSSAPSSTT
jgi:hypothetical protein